MPPDVERMNVPYPQAHLNKYTPYIPCTPRYIFLELMDALVDKQHSILLYLHVGDPERQCRSQCFTDKITTNKY